MFSPSLFCFFLASLRVVLTISVTVLRVVFTISVTVLVCGLAPTTNNRQWYYWYLTDEGIEYLRGYR